MCLAMMITLVEQAYYSSFQLVSLLFNFFHKSSYTYYNILKIIKLISMGYTCSHKSTTILSYTLPFSLLILGLCTFLYEIRIKLSMCHFIYQSPPSILYHSISTSPKTCYCEPFTSA